MIKLEIDKSEYYDFVLTNDDKTYNRNYDSYILFDINVTESLTSNIGSQIKEDVVLENISINGYDNFFIPFGNGTIDPSVIFEYEAGDRFMLHAVSGFTNQFTYNISEYSDYHKLNGGFYQGTFKYHGYPIEFMPNRFRKGWSVEMLINSPVTNNIQNTMNEVYPSNSGFIFYFGTRAQNKLINKTPVEINILDDSYQITFKDVVNEYSRGFYSLNDEPYYGYFNITNGIVYTERNFSENSVELSYNEKYSDIINNAFGIRIKPDGKIGYRTIYQNDPCYTGETKNESGEIIDRNVDVSGITTNSFVNVTTECDNFGIYRIHTKNFVIEESYSNIPILQNSANKSIHISVVFDSLYPLETECELKYADFRKGTLSIYANGFLVYRNKNFNEIIPHYLDEDYRLQERVPFNISFGGGTQGLIESLKLDQTKNVDDILSKFFAGSFMGGITSIKMYSIPLYVTEIREDIKQNYNNINALRGGRRINLNTIL